jgi:sulfur-oxidizing protein SoxY
MVLSARPLLALIFLVSFNQYVIADTSSEMWDKVRAALFAGRPISEQSENVLSLETPVRAEDASTVPIAIHAKLAGAGNRSIKKIYLVIDKNPSPLGAVFTFYPDSGSADLETRVRVEEYSFVRAIAELSDGSLYMAANYVKAAGGCSAPGGKDQAAALARLGKMKLRIDAPIALNQPNQAQLMVSHPNNSGLVMDQMTRLYEPSNFVRRIDVTYAGKPVLTADVDFTISENPNFRFYFVPRGDGELKAEVVDSHDLKFESSLAIRQGTGVAN